MLPISCPTDFIPEALLNAVPFVRRGSSGKMVAVYRCNRGLVTSAKEGRTESPREVEVKCRRGPNGGVIAPANFTCVPGFCALDVLRELEHARVTEAKRSISVDSTVTIECDKGYTIDGVASGPKTRELRCDQDTSLTPLYTPFEDNDCKPIRCGEINVPENAHIVSNHKALQRPHYNDIVKFKCDEGFFFQPASVNSRIPAGTFAFSYRCVYSGEMISVEDPESIVPGKCVPAKCPAPPEYIRADVVAKLTDHVYVGQEVKYVCQRGSNFINSTTISKQLQRFIPPKSEFKISCIWDQAEKVGVYDTDPSIARCVIGTLP